MLNSVYITVGVTLIIALLAALVGPFFVDWTAYRSTFEAYGEKVLGHRVAVRGNADMRLLPIPTLTFTDVRVGELEDPLLAVSRFVVRIELPPLLKGEIKVLDMKLERPDLRLSLDESGRLDWFTATQKSSVLSEIDPQKVTLDQVEIVDGSATIVDARSGKTHAVSDIDLLVTARSLLGPFKVDGTAMVGDERATLRIATGRQDVGGDIRLKSQITPVSVPADFLFDGKLSHDDGRPAYEGTFGVKSITPEEDLAHAWQAEGEFLMDVRAFAFNGANLRYGPEERPISLEGDGEILIDGAPRFDVKARAKQIDVDRLAGSGPQEPLAIDKAFSLLGATMLDLPPLPLPGHVQLDIPATVIGGGILQDMRIDAETQGTGWHIAELSASLPGRTEFLLRGDLRQQPDPSFRGSFAVQVEQPNGFADWWRKGVALADPVSPFAVQARIDATQSSVALTDLEFHIAEHIGRGIFSYRAPQRGRPSLVADLDAERVDLDQVTLLARLFLAEQDGSLMPFIAAKTDISLKLVADEVVSGGITARSVAIDALLSEDTLAVTQLNIRDVAGANLSAEGEIYDLSTTPRGRLDGKVEATRLAGFIRLLQGAFPENAALSSLQRASDLLSPANLTLQFSGEGADGAAGTVSGGSDDAGTKAEVSLAGTLGGSELKARASLDGRMDRWREAAFDVEAGLSGPDGAKLLKQLGANLLPVASLGNGRIDFAAKGIPGDVLQARLRAEASEASLLAIGHVSLPEGKAAQYSGDVILKAEDLMPFALLTGKLPPLLSGDTSIDLSVGLSGEGGKFALRDIVGSVAGVQMDGSLDGDLRLDIADLLPKITGKISLSSLDLAFLSELAFGVDQWSSDGGAPPSDGAAWPTGAFGPPLVDGLDIAVDVEADRVELGRGFTADTAKGHLRLKPGELLIDGGEAGFAGGRLSGTLAIKRSDGQAGLSSSLRVTDADLSSLIWKRYGRPVATGRADVNANFEAAGRSINGLVSSLSGGGTFAIRRGELRSLNPEAFDLVIRAVDAGLDLRDEEITRAFESHLDIGSLPFNAIDGSFAIAGGIARIRNVSVDNEAAALFGNAQVDLEKLRIDSDFALKVDPGEEAVTGAEPQVGLVFAGPLDEPARRIDIAPFTAFLTLRALEKEVRQVEDLQAEISERDRLTRELRRERQERRRREREAQEAAAAEEAARAAEAERKAAEDAARGGASLLPVPLAPLIESPAAPVPQTPVPPIAPARPALSSPAAAENASRQNSSAGGLAAPSLAPAGVDPATGAGEQTSFEDRIRAVIDAAQRKRRSALPSDTSEGGNGLAPFDEPILIAPLPPPETPGQGGSGGNALEPTGSISRKTEAPAVSTPQAPQPAATSRTQPAATSQRRSNRETPPSLPKYIMLPNGLLVPAPQ